MNFLDEILKLEDEEESVGFKIDALLKERGWVSRCDFPDGRWRLCKVVNGTLLAVGRDDAVSIEKYFDN